MTQDEFFAELCRSLGWEPTPWRVAVFNFWAQHEGMPFARTFNPLATTRLSANTPLDQAFDIGFGPGTWNSVGVRVYRDVAAGIAATAETLSLPYYPNIRRCFADQAGYDDAITEFRTYVGSDAYGRRVIDYMKALTAAKAAGPSLEERVARLERIVAANGVDTAGGSRLLGEAALGYADERGMSLVLGLAHTQSALAEHLARRCACAHSETGASG